MQLCVRLDTRSGASCIVYASLRRLAPAVRAVAILRILDSNTTEKMMVVPMLLIIRHMSMNRIWDQSRRRRDCGSGQDEIVARPAAWDAALAASLNALANFRRKNTSFVKRP